MAKKSRRLPGGKVRKPLAQRPRPTGQPGPPAIAPVENEVDDEVAPAPVIPPAVTPLGAARPTPALARPTPAARPAAAELRRTGVGARRAAGAAGLAPRRSTSLMELAAANYSHIRADLARIGILALIMLAIIVGLSFVLK